MKWILGVLIFSVSAFCLADAASVVPVAATSVAAPAVTSTQTVLQKIDAAIPQAIPAGVLAIIAMLLEVIMRAVPTLKPQSLFVLASGAMKLISDIMLKISALLDQVLQNIKS